jgi:hypothetical protein
MKGLLFGLTHPSQLLVIVEASGFEPPVPNVHIVVPARVADALRPAAQSRRLDPTWLHEIFAKFDVRGPTLVAAHPQPNENAWLLGYAAMRQGKDVGMVGPRGVAPTLSN